MHKRILFFLLGALLVALAAAFRLWDLVLPSSTSPALAEATRPPEPRVVAVALPSATATPSPSPTISAPLPTDAPAEPSATPTASLPEEHYIRDISGHRQYFTLGCEAATAKDWANYFGFDFNEFEFQYKLPLSDNPDLGFVGDVNAPWGQVPPYGYGVHAAPVAELLNQYGIPAAAYKGYTLEEIRENIAQDQPVIAWVIGNVVGGVPYEYTDSQGNTTIVAAYEHVVIVTGYSATHIRYMTNGRFIDTPNEVFLNSWGVLGNMVITVQ